MENAWRFRMVRVAKENSKTNVLLNNHHNLPLQKNLSALHSLTVLSRVRGGAPSWRGADVVRLQPSSVAFVRTVCCGIEKDMIKHNFFDISIRADGIPPNATT